ncbi:STAS domain-containing protein [Bradyrhizobium sp. cf659]|uniref:STAS domain-containing protein n=1 Tax=Bradyrhizobium sp. cf659 TaxID=1761771 RepID=UPI0008EEAC35|nr:hypothetical protein [Bradyrhizobium sp. cf659]SFH69645.1 hypothetical protein SAMN04487925_10141 [Bradyrhizobium sp. cf659]
MPGELEAIVVALNAPRLRSDVSGFSQLAQLHSRIEKLADKEIRVDMSGVEWMDGHLASAFLILARRASIFGNVVRCMNTRPAVKNVLQRNGLFRNRIEDRTKTTMPVRQFALDAAVEFSQYARQHLGRRELPQMSPALENKFYEGIDELFANSALHSKAPIPVVVCGQFYPRTKLLDFCIVDGGRTIPGSLREAGIVRSSDAAAIDWAMAPGNTTRRGDIPGGLGSKVLRDFIGVNGGKITIVSGAGLWMQTGKGVTQGRLTHPFPGTSVVLEINTSDKNLYDLVGGPKAEEIW